MTVLLQATAQAITQQRGRLGLCLSNAVTAHGRNTARNYGRSHGKNYRRTRHRTSTHSGGGHIYTSYRQSYASATHRITAG
jgi:hypothetical protein